MIVIDGYFIIGLVLGCWLSFKVRSFLVEMRIRFYQNKLFQKRTDAMNTMYEIFEKEGYARREPENR